MARRSAPLKAGKNVAPAALKTEPASGKPPLIVGVGASAGGFEAFRQLLHALPTDTGMAFVLVQHLDPSHQSMLTKLLSKATEIPVCEVTDGMAVEPNRIYVMPPNTTLAIQDGVLHLVARGDHATKHMPVDTFLRSLAEDQGSRAIGVILSGTASDGTLGLKAIKAEGGITFAQDEKPAKYDGMPRSAVAAGCVDFILPPEEIARELSRLRQQLPLTIEQLAKEVELPLERPGDLDQVFRMLRAATGVDFTHYKSSTIRRRVARHMVLHKIESLRQYLKFLREHPTELRALYEDILIHVTGFFREPELFQVLRKEIFPTVLSGKRPEDPVRIWVPGCSTGEEAYSLAITLLECLAERAVGTTVQMFATDISESAIEKARAGVYPESSMAEIPSEQLRRFFVKVEGGFQVAKLVRDMCVFARQDLGKDPPFSRLDLISCRNVLIYMGPVLQRRVMGILHYALKPDGFLVLGKSESIRGYADLFAAMDQKNKIYTRKAGKLRPTLEVTPAAQEPLSGEPPRPPQAPERFDVQREADRVILGRYAPAGFIVDNNLQIVHFRGQCSPYLAPQPGEASLSLLRMVRPEFAVELRSAFRRVKKEDGPVRKEGLRIRRNGQPCDLSLEVLPITSPAKEKYFLVLFEESALPVESESKARLRETKTTQQERAEIANLRRELQTAKEYLQSIIEELEGTNEELQSANEEVLSANEELQSTNEELETAKEELQSTNEELVTVNEQIQNRNAELAQLNDHLANLLSGVNIPIVMLGNDRSIRRFTPPAQKLLNLLPADVGRPIHNIRPNIQLPDLETSLAQVLETATVLEREVQDAQGRWYSMCIRPYRTTGNRIEGVVLIFIDIDARKRSEEALRQERDFEAAILDTAALVVVHDYQGRVVRLNRAYQETGGYSLEEVQDRPPWELLSASQDAERVKAMFQNLLLGQKSPPDEFELLTKDGQRRRICWVGTPLRDAQGSVNYVVLKGIEVTELRRAQEALQHSEAALRESQERLRALTGRLLQVQEEEGRRIARELHDDLNQRLAELAVDAEDLSQRPPKSAKELSQALGSIGQRLGLLSDAVHRTAYQLHPSAIEHLGVGPALKQYCAEFTQREKIAVRFSQRRLPPTIPPDIGLCVYRVTQEALHNVAKHSAAKQAWVSLSGGGDGLRLQVWDRGQGFDPALPRNTGLGLIGVEERIRLVGGTLTIHARPQHGVRLEVHVPLLKPPNPPA